MDIQSHKDYYIEESNNTYHTKIRLANPHSLLQVEHYYTQSMYLVKAAEPHKEEFQHQQYSQQYLLQLNMFSKSQSNPTQPMTTSL